MENEKKAFGGVIFTFSSNIVVKIFSFMLHFLILNFLNPIEAGLFYLVYSMQGIFGIFLSFGLNQAIPRFIPFYIGKGEKKRAKIILIQDFLLILFFSFASFLFFLFFSNSFATFFQKDISDLIPLGSLFSIFAVLFFLFHSYINGLGKFKTFAFFDSLCAILRCAFLILFLLFFEKNAYNSFLAIVLAQILVVFLLIAYVFLQLFKNSNFGMSFFEIISFDLGKHLKEQLSFGIPVYIASTTTLIANWLDVAFLGKFSTEEAIAIYNAGIQVARNIPFFIIRPTEIVFSPILSKLASKQKNRKEMLSLIKRNYKWNLFLGLPLLFVFLSFPKEIMQTFFPIYQDSYWLLYLLAPAFSTTFISAPFRNFLYALCKTRVFIYVSFFSVVLNFILMLFLVPPYGIFGAAFSTFITLLFSDLIFIYFSNKINKINLELKLLFSSFLFSFFILFFNIFILKNLFYDLFGRFIFVLCVLNIPLYLLFFIYVKMIDKKDKDIFVNFFLKKGDKK